MIPTRSTKQVTARANLIVQNPEQFSAELVKTLKKPLNPRWTDEEHQALVKALKDFGKDYE